MEPTLGTVVALSLSLSPLHVPVLLCIRSLFLKKLKKKLIFKRKKDGRENSMAES